MSAIGTRTILLVEDDLRLLTLFSSGLQDQGFQVLTATSVQQALDVCTQHAGPIDLLVTDLLLPNTDELQLKRDNFQRSRMSGVDLMRQVLVARPQVQVLLMSGRSDNDLRALGVFKTGKPLLRKPFGVDTLLEMVQQVLGASSETQSSPAG